MPRNGSGTHSIPISFTPNTKIRSADMNTDLADLGTEITNSLPRDGQAAMLANLDLGGFEARNAAPGTASSSLVNKAQLDASTAAAATAVAGAALKVAGARAWGVIYLSGGTPFLSPAYNVASVSDTGVGVVTVTFTNPMPDVFFAVTASAMDISPVMAVGTAVSASQMIIRAYTYAGVAVDPIGYSFAVFSL